MFEMDGEVYLPTETLAHALDKAKIDRKDAATLEEDKDYTWKISVIKHRRFKYAWEMMIIFIALYSVLVIPIRLGINTTLWEPAYDYIDMITWLIYLTDVVFNLRMTYINIFGTEVIDGKKIMKNYVGTFRFFVDVVSLLNFPTLISKGFSKTASVVLNIFGLFKLSRYFRARGLIVESRLNKDTKAKASCGFYFVLLLIYLHMVGSLFFYICLTTYENSSTRLGIIDELGLRQVEPITEEYIYFFDYVKPNAE